MEPRNLFPDARAYRGLDLRDYVEKRLVELAKDRDLYLSEIAQQDQGLADLAGSILLGHGVVDNIPKTDFPVPGELAEYRVRLRPINGHQTVRYKAGRKKVREVRKRGNRVAIMDADMREHTPGTDGTVCLYAQDAWRALRQHGKHCARSNPRRAERQEKEWWFEEVINPTPSSAPSSKSTAGSKKGYR